jgi:hypothetical protein
MSETLGICDRVLTDFEYHQLRQVFRINTLKNVKDRSLPLLAALMSIRDPRVLDKMSHYSLIFVNDRDDINDIIWLLHNTFREHVDPEHKVPAEKC